MPILLLENSVRERRTALGLTQQALADAVGVSRQSINAIEQGKYIPSLPLAIQLARVFGVGTDDCFTLTERRR
jgi:putative transcriptional regulator